MSITEDLQSQSIGRAVLVDVSADGFATMLARYADKAGLFEGSTGRQARVVNIGQLRRGMGLNRIAAGGVVEIQLDNTDGAIDWMCGRENISTAAKLRFRVYLATYQLSDPQGTANTRALGEYVLTEWPRRTDSTVTLQLGDDIIGPLSQGAALPTLLDWQAVGTTTNNPIKTAMGLPASLGDGAVPVQLAFGEDWVQCLPHIIPYLTPNAAYRGWNGAVIVPVCTTADLSTVSQDIITNLRVEWISYSDAALTTDKTVNAGIQLMDLPRSVQVPTSSSGTFSTREIWRVEKSPTITKNGKQFQIVYLVVDCTLGRLDFVTDSAQGTWPDLEVFHGLGDYDAGALSWIGGMYWPVCSRVLRWFVKGVPLSAITQQADPSQHAVDVMTDLVRYYSNQTSITVDTVSAARAKAANRWAACAGLVSPWTETANNQDRRESPPNLRQVLTSIAQSSDIDVFINWAGQFAFSGEFFDDAAITSLQSAVTFSDANISDVQEWVASQGERNAIVNRIYFEGSKSNPADGLDFPFEGPFDFDVGALGVSLSDRVLELVLPQGWRPYRQQVRSPWFYRALDTTARPKIRFSTSLRGLLVDLGELFIITWQRTLAGGPYLSSAFQVESMAYAADGDVVEIVGVWRADLQTDLPYLLDDEALLVRSKGALSGACTESLAEPTWFEFGGTINLSTMGVQPGDILVLRDSTEAAGSFVRNTSYRIISIPNPTAVEVERAHPGVGTSVANADWSIERGATTYPTVISDPSNYPNGGAAFGKVTSASGTFSDASVGNFLING